MNASRKSVVTIEEKCLRLLAARERSSGELLKRLVADGFSAEEAEAEVDRLVSAGVVDDERFCRCYVEGKRNQGWGMRRIIRSLKEYAIDARDFPELFSEYSDDTDELERAEAALQLYHSRARDQYSARYRYLVTKGFSLDIVYKALAMWNESVGAASREA